MDPSFLCIHTALLDAQRKASELEHELNLLKKQRNELQLELEKAKFAKLMDNALSQEQMLKSIQKPAIVTRTKQLRRDLDDKLQILKELRDDILASPAIDAKNEEDRYADPRNISRHALLAIDAVEDAIMRLGMVLKSVGVTNPYPNSYDPGSPVVDKTADGLKL